MVNPMSPLAFYKTYGETRAEEVAKAAGTSLGNFRQIMYGGSVSRRMAKALSDASDGEITVMEILFPGEEVA